MLVELIVIDAEAEEDILVILEPTGRHSSVSQAVRVGPERSKDVEG